LSIQIDFEGRVVLVCGIGRGGIGGATARRIGAAGATIFAVDHIQTLLDQTIADVEAAGGRIVGHLADLTDPVQADPVVRMAVERFGRLDGVVNVAGGTREHEWMPLEETPTSIFRDVVNLNLEYTFRICRDAAAQMIEAGTSGSLVNFGSVSALAGAPFHGPYGAAKSGIAALTRTMALEWKPHGIRANTVSPGAVATSRVTARAGWGTNSSTGGVSANLTAVDELANTVVFLLSDLASGISGQNIVVDSALSTQFCAGSVEEMRRSIHRPG
jgi:NAD(P)-dependent dehydrogenase (short-subunit alcohol dehydrogenase family)